MLTVAVYYWCGFLYSPRECFATGILQRKSLVFFGDM